MTRLGLFELLVTNLLLFGHHHQQQKLLVSWQFSGTYDVTKYGSGWRKDVVNQCLEFEPDPDGPGHQDMPSRLVRPVLGPHHGCMPTRRTQPLPSSCACTGVPRTAKERELSWMTAASSWSAWRHAVPSPVGLTSVGKWESGDLCRLLQIVQQRQRNDLYGSHRCPP